MTLPGLLLALAVGLAVTFVITMSLCLIVDIIEGSPKRNQ